jgi:uncharacterized RDD family membrane protein YckC
MANHGSQLDTSIEIITPENITFQYRLAGPFRRVLAYVIDIVVQVVIVATGTVVMVWTLGPARAVGIGGGLVLWFLMSWFYGGVFEAFWNGQTPGKRMMHIRVLTIDGRPINGLQAMLRNVLKALDMQPVVFCQVGLIFAALNDRFQRLGDLAAGTMVVVEERQWFQGLTRVDEEQTSALAGQIPPSFRVSRSLGQALAAYVQKRSQFSVARRLEIARHLADPLTEQLDLGRDTNPDLLLCTLYQHAFIREGNGSGRPTSPLRSADGRERATIPAR